jgi:hypothetical protein
MQEEYGMLEQSNRKRGPGGTTTETLQRVVKIHHDGSERSIWKGLQILKEDVKDAKEVAIHHVEALSEERLKNLTQAVFHGANARVTIFTTPSRRALNNTAPKEKRKERNTLALSVDVGERSFKDVLRGVREAVGGRSGCESIQSLRSTKEAKLLIVLDKNEAAKDKVVKLLQDKNMKVKQVGPRERPEVVHLRGLDELATREEVQQAIEQMVGADDTIKVGPMRPHYQNTQAVTVTIAGPKAEQLVRTGLIRVGPGCCSIEKRLVVRGCQKCWAYDHAANGCKGPDRSRLCRMCGKEGHIGKTCTADKAMCVLCGEDHIMGSGRCKAFRTALNKARKLQNNKQQWAPRVEAKRRP